MNQLKPIFESLRQREELPCSYPLAMGTGPGPTYVWVREKSARSVPMGRNTGRSSFSGARTPDSLSDNESTLPRPLRKGSAPPRSTLTPGGSLPGSKAGSRPSSRPGSRPPSRQGSKPPSRHGSTLSLDSTDDSTPSRIPIHRRTTPSSSATSTRSSVIGSTTRKLTVPVNGTPTGRPRTPTGLISPASGSSTSRLGSIHRASSIPTLSGVGTRARTPSGSSTPVPNGAKVTRKASGASDTSTGVSRKGSKSTTPTEQPKQPFRL